MANGNSQMAASDRPLPLRMRPELRVQPMQLRGQTCWAIKDPLSLRYFQLRDEEFCILKMLDGRASLDHIRQHFERRFAPRRLSVGQLRSYLGVLHEQGLIVAETPGQAAQLLARSTRQKQRALWGAFTNILAIRFRGFDPEPFLNWLYPKTCWLFSLWTVVGGLLLALAAILLVTVQFDVLQSKLPEFYAFFSITNAGWLLLAVAVTKILHELGHALTCKHFGGECHEMGILLLVFTPCLYCNVSDAWMLPNKWRRMAVSAAGIYVEVVLASLCTFLWWFSEPGLLNTLCLNTMFVCSIGTLLFNGNPLLRYDGYYILSDFVEVPNLRQQSSGIVRNAAARWFLGIEPANHSLFASRHRSLLALYAVASTAYLWTVIVAILWLCHDVLKTYHLEIFAQAMAFIVVAGVVVNPIRRAAGFLRDPTRNRLINKTRLALRGGLVVALVCVLFSIPLPRRVTAPLVLEPLGARPVYVSIPGTLFESFHAGDVVEKGQPIAKLENLDLKREVEQLNSLLHQQQLHLLNLRRRRITDSKIESQIPTATERLSDIERRLKQRLQDQSRLTLTAPISGTVLPPRRRSERLATGELAWWNGTPLEERNLGCHLKTGTKFCLIGDPQQAEAVLVIGQADIELVRIGQRVRIRLDELPGRILWGTVTEIAEIDLRIAPRQLAAHSDLPIRIDENAGSRPLTTSYQTRVSLDGYPHRLLFGATGVAKIQVASQSLAKRLTNYFRRTFHFEL